MFANQEEWDEETEELFEEDMYEEYMQWKGEPIPTKLTDFTVDKAGTHIVLVSEYYGKKRELRVNKEVLSYHSNYFNTLLGSPNFVEAGSDRIEIEHGYEELQMCIEIAHGAADHPKGTMGLCRLQRLIIAGDRFDLPIVRKYCEAELIQKNEEEDVVRAYHRGC